MFGHDIVTLDPFIDWYCKDDNDNSNDDNDDNDDNYGIKSKSWWISFRSHERLLYV